MPKRALLVGIDTYDHASNLAGCVADAKAMGEVLERHKDGKRNYECRVLADRMEDGQPIGRATLRAVCRELFENFKGDILFYFSGHGILTPEGVTCAPVMPRKRTGECPCRILCRWPLSHSPVTFCLS